MYFDTHTHIDDEKYDGGQEQVVREALDAGVTMMMNVGSDLASSARSVALEEKYDCVWAAVGIHPSETTGLTDADYEELIRLAGHEKVRAIGEIGLDYHYEDTDKAAQFPAFHRQLEIAQALGLPVIVHNREATADTVAILQEHPQVRGIVHSYSGSAETAKILLKMGYYLSFNGICTFKNAERTREVLMTVPRDRLLIETDCPYLSPEPFRGTRNCPAKVVCVAQRIAELWGVSPEEVARQTTENGKAIYGIK